jgi:hypothetical protein
MMKYVFVLILLLVGGAASVQGILLVYRWNHNMTVTQRIMPGEMSFAMAPGSLAREGGQLYYSKEQREAASARKNPVPPTPESKIMSGVRIYVVNCTPCHGPSGKGEGLVATNFVPPPDR